MMQVLRCAGVQHSLRAARPLGDQDYFTALRLFRPDTIRVLPCRWNRQLCMQSYLMGPSLSPCRKSVPICHREGRTGRGLSGVSDSTRERQQPTDTHAHMHARTHTHTHADEYRGAGTMEATKPPPHFQGDPGAASQVLTSIQSTGGGSHQRPRSQAKDVSARRVYHTW